MEWIKISKDNLPEYDETVYLYFLGDEKAVLGFRKYTDKGGEHYALMYEKETLKVGATHFMRLPEVPES